MEVKRSTIANTIATATIELQIWRCFEDFLLSTTNISKMFIIAKEIEYPVVIVVKERSKKVSSFKFFQLRNQNDKNF